MTTARRIAVLLPPAEAGDNPEKLLVAAAALAQGGTLDVLALRQSGAAPLPPQNLAAPTRWWDLSHPTLARFDADNLVPLFAQAIDIAGLNTPTLLLLPQGPLGEECAARLASLLQGVSLGRCTDLALAGEEVVGTRPAYGGRVALQLASAAACCLATWRPAAPAPVTAQWASPQVHQAVLSAVLPPAPEATVDEAMDKMPALEGARLVVSGGRGMQGETGFALLGRIAGQLGAALGAAFPPWMPAGCRWHGKLANQGNSSARGFTSRSAFPVRRSTWRVCLQTAASSRSIKTLAHRFLRALMWGWLPSGRNYCPCWPKSWRPPQSPRTADLHGARLWAPPSRGR
nr:FAD-binding protein [Acidovorax carolinensis]